MENASPKPAPVENRPKPAEPAPAEGRKGSTRRVVLLVLLAIGLVAGGLWGWKTIHFYQGHIETDDAQVEAHIDPVIPKVAGYVRQVLVDDNQKVKQGDLLLTIDDVTPFSKRSRERSSSSSARRSFSTATRERSRALS